MRKTLCLFYRLGFLIFGLWAFLEGAHYTWQGIPELFVQTPFLIDFICWLFILIGFLILLRSQPPQIYFILKFGATILAAWFFVQNWNDFLNILHPDWMVRVLLPGMAVLDWLFFDKKGNLRFLDLLLCLLGALAVIGLLSWLPVLLKLPGAVPVDWRSLLDFLLQAGSAAGLMYLLDKLFSGGTKRVQDWICLAYRLIFLILEGWAFYSLSGGDLRTMLGGFRYFSVLMNGLAFLCITIMLICILLKAGGQGKKLAAVLRVKGLIMLGFVLVFLYNFLVLKGVSVAWTAAFVHGALCPVLFLLDWLFFDRKGAFRAFDPFIWMIVPAVYYGVTGLILKPFYQVNLYPPLYETAPLILIGAGVLILLSAGYFLYILDQLLKRK